ncbi:MAG: HWE histidine kinase domain-containing protein, partial [Ancalomicrobiaceae bacterium]|nr:HWE histidine kinase domain-containing protein [Ancalomicrobiaceae bacterium]
MPLDDPDQTGRWSMQLGPTNLLGYLPLTTVGRGYVTDGSIVALQIISELVTAIACFAAALGIAWYARHRHGMADEYRRVAILLCTFAVACGLTRIVDVSLVWFPYFWVIGLLEAFTAATTLVAAVALWPKLPGLIALPSSRDLMDANRQLAAEQLARNELVDRLRKLNDELEQRVAARTVELAEAKHRFEMALLGSNIAMSEQDRDLRYVWVHNPPEGMLSGQASEGIVGKLPVEFLPKATEQILDVAKHRVLATCQPERVEVSLRLGNATRWFDERIEPVLRDGEIIGVVSVAIDVTSHKRYEQHLRNLLRELTHRSKNLLAVVQGLARQTAETVDTLPEFIERFGSRLQTLSGAHELLVRRSWQGVELQELAVQVMQADLPALTEKVTIRGEREILGPEAAQNIALGLHELTVNALTYGALSSPDGRVEISWGRVTVDDADFLELRWGEFGGPAVEEPNHRGFGRT